MSSSIKTLRILCVVSGDYGNRHVDNLVKRAPTSWSLETWQAPGALPLMMDYPEDFLPAVLPEADLILSFAEIKGVAELLPDMARMTGAQAVIAAVDNEAWLPRGLARQLRGWLEKMGVACATPKPLCSLTETDYLIARRGRIAHNSPIIAEFARYFGQPDFEIEVDPETHLITSARVKRDAVCGCARYVADNLIGVSADDAEEKSGLLHHHFPCLASMGIDADFGDTLMHISGNLFKDNIGGQVKPFKKVQYIAPGFRSDDERSDEPNLS
jgi:thymidylate synthase